MSLRVDSNSEFTIAIFPDTQYYTSNENGIFEQMSQWVADNASEYNIRVLLHEGDVVQTGDDSPAEWDIATESIETVSAAGVPSVIALGNHDANDVRNPTTFRDSFPATRYEEMVDDYETVTCAGTYDGHAENAYLVMDILGETFLFFTVEFGPRDAVVRWADDLLSTHSDATAFLTTHSFTDCDGSLVHDGSDHAPGTYGIDTTTNNGKALYHELVRRHDNLVNVHSGHHIGGAYTATRYTVNDSGNAVTQMYQNYQDISNGGDGWFRLLTVDTETGDARVNTFSPYLGEWSTDPGETFEFELVSDSVPYPGPKEPLNTNTTGEWDNAVLVQFPNGKWKSSRIGK